MLHLIHVLQWVFPLAVGILVVYIVSKRKKTGQRDSKQSKIALVVLLACWVAMVAFSFIAHH